MRARVYASGIFLCLAASMLTACGGGGGSASMLPAAIAAPGSPAAPSAGSAPASVAISIAIPTATASSSVRRVHYVSAATRSASVSYGAVTQTVNCAATCSLVTTVAPGTVTFAIRLFDGLNGSGNVLSTGQTTATIVSGQSNSLNVVFGGVVASVAVSLGQNAVSAGTPATIPVSVTARDAAGYTIVGSDPYATPIVLAVDAAACSLSTATVSSPASSVTLSYSGAPSATGAHVSASISGSSISATPAGLTIAPAAAPSAGAPGHVATYYFYGINGVNASIPAGWMAAHADYVEDDGDGVQHATAFKQAGGKYAVSYTDPAYVPY
ncbi:MAG: hypothetical protein JOZ24_04930, partial [Candidatus Eremiobacteraeota bacterium]|nr:hypothetical protein [Candidatus Eremiobacteraeota bacterium]